MIELFVCLGQTFHNTIIEVVMKNVGIYLKSGFGNLGFSAGAVPTLMKCLDAHKIKIVKIIGCSASSFIVPLLSIRKYNDILTAWFNLTPDDVSKFHFWDTLLHKIFQEAALLDFKPLRRYASGFLNSYLDEVFSNQAIPFEIIATDLMTGEGVYFPNSPENKTNLLEICMSSAAIVPFAEFIKIEDRILIDGGFSDDLPIRRLAESGCDTVFVFDLYNGIPALNKRDKGEFFWPALLMRGIQITIAQHSRLRYELGEKINSELSFARQWSGIGDHDQSMRQALGLDFFSSCSIKTVSAEIPIFHITFRHFDGFTQQVLPEIGYYAAKTALNHIRLNNDMI